MEIDLDNLVFNGLDEAEERNAERLDDADKKARRLSPMTTAAMPARSEEKAPGSPVLFMDAFATRYQISGVLLNPVSIRIRLWGDEPVSN